MQKPLINLSQEIPTGIFPDLEQDKIPLWSDAENVLFEDGGIRPYYGQFVVANKLQTAPGTGLIELIQGGKRVLFWGTPKIGSVKGKLFRWEEGQNSAEDVSRAGDYDGTGIWHLSPWGEQILATNGFDPPQIYGHPDDLNDFVNLYNATGVTGLLSTDKWEMVAHLGPFPFAFSLDTNPEALRWASEDDVNLWLPAAGNSAGDLPIRDLNSKIMSVVHLGEGFGIYGNDQLHLVYFQGGQLVFGQRPLLYGLGAVGKHSVCSTGPVNFGLGPRGFFRTDGNQVDYIDVDAVHDYLFSIIDFSQVHKVICWPDITANHVFWCLPLLGGSGDNDITVGYNWKTKAWSRAGFARSAVTPGSVFQEPHFIARDGSIYRQANNIVSQGGLPLILSADVTLKLGYGEGGYGEGGYGGEELMDG